MKTITLINVGSRIICYGRNGRFLPGKAVSFPFDEAQKLKRLFSGEVKTVEDLAAPYSAPLPSEIVRPTRESRIPEPIKVAEFEPQDSDNNGKDIVVEPDGKISEFEEKVEGSKKRKNKRFDGTKG